MKTGITVGDLKKAFQGLDDDLPVWVETEAVNEGEIDTLTAIAVGSVFAKAGNGSIFNGPPVDRLVIDADAVPEGTCRECCKSDGKHLKFCGESRRNKHVDE